MAQRGGISSDDFRDALSDLFVCNREEQYKLFHDPEKLDAMADHICRTLVQINNINVDCQALAGDLVHLEQANLISKTSRELANASIYRRFKKDNGRSLRNTLSRSRKQGCNNIRPITLAANIDVRSIQVYIRLILNAYS
jgi:hypothetical protein